MQKLHVVLYPKDTEKWKQFTTKDIVQIRLLQLFCIPKILKNESNSQQYKTNKQFIVCCFVSQRYWKMKAIHNTWLFLQRLPCVVLYPKDTEKWKQFTTNQMPSNFWSLLFCIPKILKNESNSQQVFGYGRFRMSCFVSQRYWKMKAIHNNLFASAWTFAVVLYPKDTEKWKQFTTW